MPQGYVKPVNAIVADTEGLISHEYEIGANATAAKMLPGIGVEFDTSDWCVKETADESKVVLGVLDVASDMLITDAYAVGDPCRVIEHGKCLVRLLAGGAAVQPGTPLVVNADGLWQKQAVGAIGTQGAPPAYALESVNPVAQTLCLAMVTGQREAAAAA